MRKVLAEVRRRQKKAGSPEAATSPPGRFFCPSGSRLWPSAYFPESCNLGTQNIEGSRLISSEIRRFYGLNLDQRLTDYELRPVSSSAAPQCFTALLAWNRSKSGGCSPSFRGEFRRWMIWLSQAAK